MYTGTSQRGSVAELSARDPTGVGPFLAVFECLVSRAIPMGSREHALTAPRPPKRVQILMVKFYALSASAWPTLFTCAPNRSLAFNELMRDIKRTDIRVHQKTVFLV